MDYVELAASLRYYATHVPNLSASFYAHLWQAADAIEELSKPRWISVKERLPQEHEMVLAYCADDNFYYISRMHKSFEDYEVTHWLPLTTPSKEDAGAV